MTRILAWDGNDEHWRQAGGFAGAVARSAAGTTTTTRWSVGRNRPSIYIGETAYLYRGHVDTGLIARGSIVSLPFLAPHYDPERAAAGETMTYVNVEWHEVRPLEDTIPVDELMQRVPTFKWKNIYQSGNEAHPPADEQLDELWGADRFGLDEERLFGTTGFVEGNRSAVLVNRYERDPRARKACLGHYGYECSACGQDMATLYGPLGVDFIHVHHVRELSSLGPGYKVDPVADLRPLCPNCHAIVHRQRPALDVDVLRLHLLKKRVPQ
jgi:5-methylcytosine-specific restriction protein A